MPMTGGTARAVCCAVLAFVCAESAATGQAPSLFGRVKGSEIPAAQARRLAEIAPRSMNRDSTGSVVSLAADEIERLDLRDVVTRSGDGGFEVNEPRLIDELVAAIDRMGVLTLRKHTPAIVIQKASATSEELFVRFNELLDGIPVENDGLIVADLTGRIRDYGFGMLPDDVSPGDRRQWLTEQQAVALAQKAIVSQHGGALPVGGGAKLRYKRVSERQVNPEWLVQFGPNTMYFAILDAITGETRTLPAFIQ